MAITLVLICLVFNLVLQWCAEVRQQYAVRVCAPDHGRSLLPRRGGTKHQITEPRRTVRAYPCR